jgi:carbon-monoxide dehydrogenase small subunit|tara:strand:- start:493 stop:960 length:468 start_codon:yes stop_codon:yes gene_type:complete
VRIELTVNTRDVSVEAPPTETLLATLRERLQLTGTKEACVEGECGACTVLVNGRPVDSCIYATAAADGLSITTVEGLGGPDGSLSPLQQSFVDHFAIQCGFCTPGFLVTLSALLEVNPDPDREEIENAIAGNLCRCTGYTQIVEAVEAMNQETVS